MRFFELLNETIADSVGAKAAKSLTPAVSLLVEGAIITSVMEQSFKLAEIARKAALELIANSQAA